MWQFALDLARPSFRAPGSNGVESSLTSRQVSVEQQRLWVSLQNLIERLRDLPGLLVADVCIADRRADMLMAEELLDFPKLLSHLVEEDCGRGMPQPKRSACCAQPQIE